VARRARARTHTHANANTSEAWPPHVIATGLVKVCCSLKTGPVLLVLNPCIPGEDCVYLCVYVCMHVCMPIYAALYMYVGLYMYVCM